jgi:small multidrug resistance pump
MFDCKLVSGITGNLHRKKRFTSMMKTWLLLTAAILLEVAGTTSMKISAGFTRLVPSVLIFVFYAASFTVLTLALRKLDISIAYAIWSGLGTVLITMIGIFWFKEPATALKLTCILLIILGVVGLNLGGAKN